MKLEQSFEVQAPIDVVWRALNDLERVAPCLPGATITGRDDDGTYRGEFKVKLGPTTAAYRGTIRISEADEAAHVATLVAKGSDKRGQGGANATIVNTLTDLGGTTRVEAVTDFSITGRLAGFGRGGMIEDISSKLLRTFGDCLATRLGEQVTPAEPTGAEVTAGDAAPESVAVAPEAEPASTGAEVTAGDAAPESAAAPAEDLTAASSGADVAAGDVAPEAVAAPEGDAPREPASEPAGDATPPSAAAVPESLPATGAGQAAAAAGEVAPGRELSAEEASAGAAPPPPVPQAAPAGAGTPGPGPAASTPPPSAKPASPPPAKNEPLKTGGLWERLKRLFGGRRA